MRTQPTSSDTTISSLDRTDVLPVLDVEAYEDTLVESQKSLSRTDTWTVDALQDIDELIESATHEAPVEVRGINVNREAPAAEAFTVNIDRILKRIADLEADIVKAHDANAVLIKRNDALQTERDRHAARIEALTTEQSRLAEHRALAEEMAQRSEKQLREELQKLEARLKDSDRSLSHEKASAAELARRFAAKLSEHDKLVAIIEQHNRTINDIVTVRDDLDQRLRHELASGVELKAKLSAAEETVAANRALLLEREGALAEDSRKQAELSTQITELRNLLQTADGRVQDAHREVTVAAKARGDEERRRVEIETQLRDAHTRHETVTAERDAAHAQIRVLTNERDALLPAATELATRTAELERSSGTVAKLRDELASAQMDAQASEQLAQERADEIVAMRERIEGSETALRQLEQSLKDREQAAEALGAQLQTAHDECSIMAEQREKARARAKQLTQEIFRRDHKIEELQADLAVHSEALAAIRRDVNRIGEKAAGENAALPGPEEVEWILEPIEHAGDLLRLTGSMLTIGRTAENDIALASKMVSRHHARLLIGPTGIIVEDAGSTNGCFVNGEQVKQHLMHDGDVLELGDLRYRLRLRAARDTAVRANVVPLFEQSSD
ncbi:MAG TPA: FHA domain-containing protein [Steroidobacteraceae bacterium]|jgi:chromosome segregation ATPase|nr:FHA domain-containing protein [Steroidobacteraceae bacterium]